MSDSSRPVVQVVASAPVVEGAGVRLRRSVGTLAPGARSPRSCATRSPRARRIPPGSPTIQREQAAQEALAGHRVVAALRAVLRVDVSRWPRSFCPI